MILFPAAKINIGLRITGERADGYHNIESVFCPVPLCDVLEFLPSETFELSLYGKPVPGMPEENLITKTWKLLNQKFSIPPVRVALMKNIPPGSGLGGGASDAAFFLNGLNEFFHLNRSSAALQELALQLGSDVPFFLQNRPALVSGRGEEIKPITLPVKNLWLMLVLPPVHCATGQMFSLTKPGKFTAPLTEFLRQPVETWSLFVKNDFQEIATRQNPVLYRVQQELIKRKPVYWSMTGSGCAFYAFFRKKPSVSFPEFMGEVRVFRFPGY
ncbi:4-(cytidine 5'-diphospho)-2-C-methyl-D-erythritol kinase [Candidatus Sulfidibacterium hydrothermale]|uniref:4-(cytidine 5'-diphospho)-2-C-methyl-D-erythritol kinase n=1 Tax=Candidatus Sulfidibacterium hydrothermale TaxID=2875962 RepID=UPI001F0A8C7F|nr:4-(cytidine 5'-diphospho)-2-C-methyl-D-erythritol kinase [Candidatus Sulfidibacterium hydrothermale]UBM61842.1 4-(cytidine 5'-diphospho)-2-C-methyl-D-erythritol kinase [Candidatus Sulfidibacterium hydrothermale]